MCSLCSGKETLIMDYFEGYSVEIDVKLKELDFCRNDTYLASFPINYCPRCGKKMR